MSATPYPFERWPRVRREDVTRSRRVARALPNAPLAEVSTVLGELLGAELEILPGPLYACVPGALTESVVEPLVAVVLRPPSNDAPLVVEVSPELALAVVDRLLGGDGTQLAEAVGGLTEIECGVVAYAAARALACTPRAWRVAGVLTTRLALLGVLADEGCSTWSAELTLRAEDAPPRRGVARVWVPDAARWTEPAPARSLSALPIEIVADAGEVTISAAELLGLGRHDVLLLDEAWWSRAGELRLRPVGSRATIWARRDDDAFAVRALESAPASPATIGRKTAMSDEQHDTTTLKALGEAPVEVSIELARVRLTLGELQALRVGEIVVTGAPIREHVRLRVGDVVIGEGELVEVHGEVGVRLTSLDAD